MITEPIELVASVETMGQPYHGPIVGSTLTLPNGASMPVAFADQQTLAYDLSAVLTHFGPRGNTAYVKFAGLPAVAAPSAQEAAEGVVWFDDAVLFGQTRQYSPRSATLSVPRLFRDAYGVVWEIDTAVSYPYTIASHPDISTAPTSGPVSLTVRAKKFGLDVTDSWHSLVSYADTLDVQPALRAIEDTWRADPLYGSGVPYYWVGDARQFTNEPVAVPWRPPLVQASPDGSRQLVALYYRNNDNFTTARWTIAKVYRVSISSGASNGTPPVASVAVAKSVTDCMSWTVTARQYGAGLKRAAHAVPAGPTLPPQPDVVTWSHHDYAADDSYTFAGASRATLLATFAADGTETYIDADYQVSQTRQWAVSGGASGSFARIDDNHWSGSAAYDVSSTLTKAYQYNLRLLRNGTAKLDFAQSESIVSTERDQAAWSLDPASSSSPYYAPSDTETNSTTGSGASTAGGRVGTDASWSGEHCVGPASDVPGAGIVQFPPPTARGLTNNLAMTDIPLASGNVWRALVAPSGDASIIGVEPPAPYRFASWNPRTGALAHGLTPVGWV